MQHWPVNCPERCSFLFTFELLQHCIVRIDWNVTDQLAIDTISSDILYSLFSLFIIFYEYYIFNVFIHAFNFIIIEVDVIVDIIFITLFNIDKKKIINDLLK